MKKIFLLLSLLGVMLLFTQSTNALVDPLIVTLYERMILYQNCANLVGTSIPTLEAYRPYFPIDNGRSVPTEKLGDVELIPNKVGTCTMVSSSFGKEVGRITFTVLPVPAPSVFLGDNKGTEISIAEPVKKGSYKIFARPDANFLNILPKEANYGIRGITLNIYRNGQKVSSKAYTSETMPFDLNDTKAGDMVQAIVTKAERINTRGQSEPAMPTNPVINFMVKD